MILKRKCVCNEINYQLSCFLFIQDINECKRKLDNCDANADCSNTVGNFTCTCKDGYEGDGVSCTGKYNLYYICAFSFDSLVNTCLANISCPSTEIKMKKLNSHYLSFWYYRISYTIK